MVTCSLLPALRWRFCDLCDVCDMFVICEDLCDMCDCCATLRFAALRLRFCDFCDFSIYYCYCCDCRELRRCVGGRRRFCVFGARQACEGPGSASRRFRVMIDSLVSSGPVILVPPSSLSALDVVEINDENKKSFSSPHVLSVQDGTDPLALNLVVIKSHYRPRPRRRRRRRQT